MKSEQHSKKLGTFILDSCVIGGTAEDEVYGFPGLTLRFGPRTETGKIRLWSLYEEEAMALRDLLNERFPVRGYASCTERAANGKPCAAALDHLGPHVDSLVQSDLKWDECNVCGGSPCRCGECSTGALPPDDDDRCIAENREVRCNLRLGHSVHFGDDGVAWHRDQHVRTPSSEAPHNPACMQSFDARDWAYDFRETAKSLGYCDMDEGWLLGWFANAIMRGFDEAERRHDAMREQVDGSKSTASLETALIRDRRERIATTVLGGFAANPMCGPMAKLNAEAAVKWADALIVELDKASPTSGPFDKG
jgi:hypothetical protein